jgi:hypothetical protein
MGGIGRARTLLGCVRDNVWICASPKKMVVNQIKSWKIHFAIELCVNGQKNRWLHDIIHYPTQTALLVAAT